MHEYQITVEDITPVLNAEDRAGISLNITVDNHDNLFHIVDAVRSKQLVDADKAAALAIGLKLLSEVALEKRRDPLFAALSESLRSFIQQLKTVQPFQS